MGYSPYDGLTVEQKFAKAMIDLRKHRPFYSAIYEVMDKIEDENIETMGVNINQFKYNPKFIDELSYPEFLFVLLHEIGHISLMHVVRRGNRDPQLWNLAADLYVNKLIADEFSILPGKSALNGSLTMPTSGCWCESLDIDTEFTEDIYESLYEQAKNNGYSKEMMENSSYDDIEGDSDITLEDGSKIGKHKKYHFEYSGKNKGKPFEIDMNVNVFSQDLLESNGDKMKQENDAKRLLSNAVTRHAMLSKEAGNTPGKLEMMVNNMLKSHIDWRKWLRKYCIKARSTDSTFSNPDKRMFYQEAIYPGQSVDECNTIKGIKVCIDTSGSISDEDLAYFMGQIYDMTKQFKIEAEVIAWDTEMHSCGAIKPDINFKELNLAGGGGTDPTCLFEYFDSRNCKVKPIVTLVFTDGYWGMNENKSWAKKYKDTLWVLTKDAHTEFKPPFGLVTDVRYDN